MCENEEIKSDTRVAPPPMSTKKGKEGCSRSTRYEKLLLSPGEGMQKMQRAAPAQVDFLLFSLSAAASDVIQNQYAHAKHKRRRSLHASCVCGAHKKTRESIKERKNNGSGHMQQREMLRIIIMCCGVFGRKKGLCSFPMKNVRELCLQGAASRGSYLLDAMR